MLSTVASQNGPSPQDTLQQLVEARFARSMSIPSAFFTAEAERIAQACWAIARRFHQGGRLIAFGNGAWASDAQHVAVEFVHPVIVGKRALPALALTNDSAVGIGLWDGQGASFTQQLEILARPRDIALGFSQQGQDSNVLAALEQAQRLGLLTLALTGGQRGLLAQTELDFYFSVPAEDLMVVQETHETLYHMLWELVHVFFEHEGLLA